MKIKIHVTKEIYRKAMFCGMDTNYSNEMDIRTNCAVACAVREIAPAAEVTKMSILWMRPSCGCQSKLPSRASLEIIHFDDLGRSRRWEDRLNLPEFSFEVDFPDSMVEQIGIDELKAILEKSETLELA